MKTKHNQHVGQQRTGSSQQPPQTRMEAYLKNTHSAFVAAVEQASQLGPAANGVLAGPRVPVRDIPGEARQAALTSSSPLADGVSGSPE